MAELFFGEYRLDTRGLILEGPEGPTELRAKTLDTLLYLIDNRNRYVSREELLEKIWPDVQVTGASVTQCISELRQALADDAKAPRFIETRVKYGYRFIAPLFHRPTERLEPLPPPAAPEEPPPSASRRVSLPVVAVVVALVVGAALVAAVLRFSPGVAPPAFAVETIVEDAADGSQTFAAAIEAGVRERLGVMTVPAPAASHLVEIRCRTRHGLRHEATVTVTDISDHVQLWGWTWVVAAGDAEALSATAASAADAVADELDGLGLLQ